MTEAETPDVVLRIRAAVHHAALRIEYDGTGYSGWGRQPDRPSVEQTLLDALAAISCDVVDLRCAGRTDAGVHASAQVASLHWNGPVPPERIARVVNGHLPRDIAVRAAAPCPLEFDARGDAISRAYRYRVLTTSAHAPLRARHVLHHPRPLDLDAMQAAARALVGTHDFTAFTPTKTLHTFFHRTVLESSWAAHGDELVYSIRGNAFLRNMVRIIVGSMLAVGRGDMTVEHFAGLLDGAPRADAYATALPQGLELVDVAYPPEVDPFR